MASLDNLTELRSFGDRILGRPYQLQGRGPTAYDCVGVILHLFARIGIELPDPAEAPTYTADGFSAFAGEFVRLVNAADICPFDMLHLRRRDQHLALAECPDWAIHTDDAHVIRSRVETLISPETRVYRHRSLA